MPAYPAFSKTDEAAEKLQVFGFPETDIRTQLVGLLEKMDLSVDFREGEIQANGGDRTVFVKNKGAVIPIPRETGGAYAVISFCGSIESAGQQALIRQKLGARGAVCCPAPNGALYIALFSREGTHSILAEPHMAALPADLLAGSGESGKATAQLLWFSAIFLLAAGRVRTLLEGADLARHIHKRYTKGN